MTSTSRHPTKQGDSPAAEVPASPRSDRFSLHRTISGHHLDDQNVYHSDDDDTHDDDQATNESNEQTVAEGLAEETAHPVDLEKGIPAPPMQSEIPKDPNLVTWDGPNDQLNPKNWPFKTKWAATAIVSMYTFISPVSSSMVAPALGQISQEFGITQSILQTMVLSAFVLAYAFGPLFLGPLSELYGRTIVLQLANLFYLVFNLACGASKNTAQLIVFRFLAGLGGSAPLAIGGGVLGDVWLAEERGRAVALYSLMPLLGPAVGPVIGGFIAQSISWRWIFWVSSIADGLIQCLGLWLLRETYAPTILARKAKKLQKETGNSAYHTEFQNPDRHWQTLFGRSLKRPFILLFTQPIVIVLSIIMMIIYGYMYLVLATFPTLWTEVYGESTSIGGLNYIALGLGFFIGSQTSAQLLDRTYRYFTKKNGGAGRPEYRIPIMVPGSLLVPIGLFIYGWTAEKHTHWIGPNIGAAIFAAGTIMSFQSIQNYLVSHFLLYFLFTNCLDRCLCTTLLCISHFSR